MATKLLSDESTWDVFLTVGVRAAEEGGGAVLLGATREAI